MCTEKNIKLSLDQARKMYGKSPEMDELLLANFSKEELEKPKLPKIWADLRVKSGYAIGADSVIILKPQFLSATYEQKNLFATEKQARSALAMAQLSQLMAAYNDGWEYNPDGNFKNTSRAYVLIRKHNGIKQDCFENNWAFLAFKSAEIRDEFLKNFEPLIKEYFMID